MAKNDFDIDFDFEKEYGFDPKAILESEYTDEDLELSQFDEADLELDLELEHSGGFDDFDLDSLDLEEDEAEALAPAPAPAAAREPVFEPESDMDLEELEDMDFEDEELDVDFEDEDLDDPEELDEDMAFTRRANFFGTDADLPPQTPVYEEPYDEAPYGEASYDEAAQEQEPVYDEPAQEEAADLDYEQAVYEEEQEDAGRDGPARRRRERPRKERKPIKLTIPPVLTNLVRLYVPNQQEINARMEAGEGRRRRRPSKQQIFKEYYLPPIILGLSLVLIFSFVLGSLANAIDSSRMKREQAEEKARQESIAAEQLATEGQNIMNQAEKLAQGYDYDGAIAMLDSYQGDPSQEMTAKRAEYMDAKRSLVEYQDPTLIPNLSFHVLIADMSRAIQDDTYGGKYNKNFVSTAEFSSILNQLYLNNYVLVDFDSFVVASSMDGTSEVYDGVSLWLPEGKKPVMITETLVNYLSYMEGSGFASRLVVDSNGDIKAEYVDANNVTQVGNYDLVPILEDFIAEHPDFCYRGARATLAVCGYEGIFGYRIQSETIANKGQDYYNEQVVGATAVVNALREKGYRLACNSFKNEDYSGMSADMVNQDLQKWKSQIAPVIGEIDTIVFPQGKDIGDYTGGKFDVVTSNGFKYLIKSGDTPYTEINNSYVRQTRLMVTGENMFSKGSMFTGNNLFDPNTVLDLTARGGNVPVG